MARQIPSGSRILTIDEKVPLKELSSQYRNSKSEFYTIDDLILTTGGGEGGSAGSLSELITITNVDGAFTHLDSIYTTSVIPAGTNTEKLLRDILNPYVLSTLDITSLYVSIKSGGSWGAFNTVTSGSDLESGQGFRIAYIIYTVSDSDSIASNSVDILSHSNSTIQSGYSNQSGSATLSTVYEVSNTSVSLSSGLSFGIKIKAVDNGGVSDIPIYSSSKIFNFYNRIKAGGSTESSVHSGNVNDLFSDLTSYETLNAKADIAFVGDSDTTDANKYTWIAYPVTWGFASDILLASISVINDFESYGQQGITNAHGIITQYFFYRSASKGAFGLNQNIKLTFN